MVNLITLLGQIVNFKTSWNLILHWQISQVHKESYSSCIWFGQMRNCYHKNIRPYTSGYREPFTTIFQCVGQLSKFFWFFGYEFWEWDPSNTVLNFETTIDIENKEIFSFG